MHQKHFRRFTVFFILFVTPLVTHAELVGTASFDRTTLIIENMEESLAFWRDVMGFEVLYGPQKLPPQDNPHLGWSAETTKVSFARVISHEGAGIGLLEIEDENFPNLNIEENPTGYGGIVMVFVAKDIEALYQRAVDAGAVYKLLTLSPSGRSQQMYLKSPGGNVLEIYEIKPKEEESASD